MYCPCLNYLSCKLVLYSILVFTLCPSYVISSSFYDNPEQDPLYQKQQDSPEELDKKWGFEVPCRVTEHEAQQCSH